MSLTKILCKFSKKSSRTVYIGVLNSPVGRVTAAADDEFLYMVSFDDAINFERKLQTVAEELSCNFVNEKNKVLQQFESELDDYFAGKLNKFTVPIKTFGSEFQKAVWEKLQELPYGSTQTYGDLAKAMGRASTHARAIGAACGANAHLLVIPCHRVVASGCKGGFSSGIDRKEWLINLEKEHA